jgi:2-C-methyl-D-erythritol 2,4-cyclodiphosphate synthase
VIDALLGAAGLGDIGLHFPDTHQEFKDADSMELLKKVCQLIREKGFEIENVDATILAQEPKLHPYRKTMENNLAHAMGISNDRINLKATTTEQLGFVGRREGLGSSAIALLFTQT